ncbi:MAG: hypothetical protein JNL90_10800 [Planctomycetes bacterium]|nr:hypothetical protein [Planctomycetota bacterium]
MTAPLVDSTTSAIALLAVLGAVCCQDASRLRANEPPVERRTSIAGTPVSDLGDSCWYVFQDQDGNHWFGSDGEGVCRYDGKSLTRFTTADGLAHDQVRAIQQHGPTGDLLVNTNGGVSKFTGGRFVPVSIVEMWPPSPTVAAAHADGEADGELEEGWRLDPGDLWMTGSGGPRRYDGTKLHQLKFPKSPLEDELAATIEHRPDWSPYDVWTVFTDRRGHAWFGTGMFGICRFDGRSFAWMFESRLTQMPGGGWLGFRSIVEDEAGDYWFGATAQRYRVEPPSADERGSVRLRYECLDGMDFTALDDERQLSHCQSIARDGRDLWMVPYRGGVWRYDGKAVAHFPLLDDRMEPITTFAIFKDRRGALWVGTHENGAYRFTGSGFERFRP